MLDSYLYDGHIHERPGQENCPHIRRPARPDKMSRAERAAARNAKRAASPAPVAQTTAAAEDEEYNPDGLSAYELQRLRNIEANNKILAALDLVGAGRALVGKPATAAKPSQRGLNKRVKRDEATPTEPTRASGRIRRQPPDAATAAGLYEERADGSIVLGTGKVVQPENRGRSKFARRVPSYSASLPIPCRRLNADSDDEEADAACEDDAKQPTNSKVVVKAEAETAAGSDEEEDDTPLIARLVQEAPPPDVHDHAILALVRAGCAGASASPDAPAKVSSRGSSPASARASARKTGREAPSAAVTSSSSSLSKPTAFGSSPAPLAAWAKMKLWSDEMVVKVTKKAVVHLDFQPRSDGEHVLAAADKEGHVSLWHADREVEHPTDGVFLFKPHLQYVSGLAWHAHHTRALYTASYDGTVRVMDVEQEHWALVHSSEESEYSAFTPAPDASALWLGTNTGQIGAADHRAGPKAVVQTFSECHEKKVNTLSFEAARGWLLASSSTDCTVAVWDVRASFKRPLARLAHPKSSQAAMWAPDGSRRLLTTCMDDTLRVFDLSAAFPLAEVRATTGTAAARGKGRGGATDAFAPSRAIRHCTQTGRWVVPFRAIWSAAGDGIVCGGMKRTCDVYEAASGKRAAVLSSEDMTAIPSRNAVHQSGHAVACATNSGRIHIYQS